MAELPPDRQLILEVRSELDQWTTRARNEAYDELFAGESPILSVDDQQLLDAVDSALERQGGDGVWGTDQYGIYSTDDTDTDLPIAVVCVYHAQITSDSVLRGFDAIDDDVEERINGALWTYCERVSALIGLELEEYVRTKS
ncbi:hypothetical protein HUB97_09300 [Halorubraceae archaeon YAN]|nr:hypothetical protein [Halorubraceae archaeon YAN]